MKISFGVCLLSALTGFLALIAAMAGLFWSDSGGAFAFTTLRGQAVQIYGQGLYRYDTALIAIGFKMADAITLCLAIPVLAFALLLYRRGSSRGAILLAGTLSYFFYDYASMSFGAAYNSLFLIYVAVMGLSLFALLLTVRSFDIKDFPNLISPSLPRRGIGVYLIVSGMSLMLIWLALSIVPALLLGRAPVEMASYTTEITVALDAGILAPTLIVAGAQLMRSRPAGYLMASVLLVFTAVLGTSLTAAGVAQVASGLISPGQFVGMSASFTLLTLFALGYSITLFRCLRDAPEGKAPSILQPMA